MSGSSENLYYVMTGKQLILQYRKGLKKKLPSNFSGLRRCVFRHVIVTEVGADWSLEV